LHATEAAALRVERADHAQRVERKLLEELAGPARLRPLHGDWIVAAALLRGVGGERPAPETRLVRGARGRPDRRPRLDAATGARLDLVDIGPQVVDLARATGGDHCRGDHQWLQ